MQEKSERSIFYPQNVHDLLILLAERPEAMIFAGGTHIMSLINHPRTIIPEDIISIGKIKELSKIIRKEKFIEVGSTVTLSKILGIGSPMINKSVIDALSLLGSPSIRNMATLGGHLCVPPVFSNLLPPLCAIEAQVELKNLYKSRWVPVHKFNSDPASSLKPMDVITRIRIPHEDWTLETFRKVSRTKTQRTASINFCGLARVNKGMISEIRFAFGAIGPQIFRSRELEAEFIGRKIPLSQKEVNPLLVRLTENLKPVTDNVSTASYRHATAIRLMHWFIDEMNNQAI